MKRERERKGMKERDKRENARKKREKVVIGRE